MSAVAALVATVLCTLMLSSAATADVSAVTFTPATSEANATGNWAVGFTSSAAGAIAGSGFNRYVEITLPSGISFPSGATFDSGFSCGVNHSAIPSPVTSDTFDLALPTGCSLGNSTAATLTLTGIKNPGTAGTYSGAALATSAEMAPISAGDIVITADMTPPETTINSGPTEGSTIKDSTPTFTFSSSEAGSTFECKVDGAAFAACTSPKTTSALADGAHTFSVRATDGADNTGTAATRHFTVDTTPPGTTINSGPTEGSTIKDTTPTFTFSSSEAGSSFACKVDSAAFAACISPKTTSALADGAHTFSVRATDTAGNIGAPATRHFTVDTTPPKTTIESGPADGSVTRDKTPTFTFSSSEAGSSFECKVNGGAFTACTSPKTTAPLVDAKHTFSVRATDAAGNTGTPATRSFWVDPTPPQTLITKKVIDNHARSAQFFFTATGGVGGLSFTCKLDTDSFKACTSGKGYSKLEYGSHTFKVLATDGAGAADPSPASYSFTIVPTSGAGKVSSPKAACVSNRTVFLYRKVSGSSTFTKIGSDKTSATGAYQINTAVQRNASYYARVDTKNLGSDACKAAQSKTITYKGRARDARRDARTGRASRPQANFNSAISFELK